MNRGGFHCGEGIGSWAQCRANPPALHISHRERDPRPQSRSREGCRKLENYSTVIFLTPSLSLHFLSHYKPMSRCRNGVPLEQVSLWTASEMFECYILHPPGPPHRLKVEKERCSPPTVNTVNKTWFKALHSKIQKQYILSDYKLFLSGCHKSQFSGLLFLLL